MEATIGKIDIQITGNADKAKKSVDNLTKSMSALSSIFKTIGAGVAVKGLLSIGKTIEKLVEKQSSFISTTNLFRNAVGDMKVELDGTTKSLQEYYERVQDVLGVDVEKLMGATSTLQRLGEGFGLPRQEVQLMSKNLTQLAADMQSTGLSFDQAFQKIKSGFSGEIEPMRAFGVALDQNSLQETAYALGIDKRVASMTRAQKTELLYYQMMTQTANIQNTLAKSVMTPANALNMLKNSFTRLARTIGSVFIPIFMKLVPVILAVTELIEQAAMAIARFFNFDISDYFVQFNQGSVAIGDVAAGLDDVGGSAKKAGKELQKMLMPFDELNNVNFDTGSTGGSGDDTALGGGSLGLDLPQYDILKDASNEMRDKIDAVKRKFEELKPVLEVAGGLIAGIFSVVQIVKFIKKVNDLMNDFDKLGKTGDLLRGALGLAFEIGGVYLIYHGVQHAIENGLDTQSLLEIVGGTGLIAVGAAMQFKSTLPLKLGAELMIGLTSAYFLYKGIKEGIDNGFTPEKIAEIVFSGAGLVGSLVSGGFTIAKAIKIKMNAGVEVGAGAASSLAGKAASTAGGAAASTGTEAISSLGKTAAAAEKPVVSLKTGFNDLLGSLGKGVQAIAILGGMAIVINSLTDLIKAFGESGVSAGEGIGLIAGAFTTLTIAFEVMYATTSKLKPSIEGIIGSVVIFAGMFAVIESIRALIDTFAQSNLSLTDALNLVAGTLATVTIAFTAMMLMMEMLEPSWASIAAAAVILGGFALIMHEITGLLNAFSKSGLQVGEVVGLMVTIFAGLAVLMALVAALGPEMAIGMGPFAVVVAGISAILLVMAATIPTILDAAGKFITTIAPTIQMILTTIGTQITNIINALGKTLPPIINSVGNVFKSIFNGISQVVNSVGSVIERVLNAIANTVERISRAVLNFVWQIGPAVSSSVSFIISAVTRLVNFVISGMEFLVNNTVVRAVNAIAGAANKLPGVNIGYASNVYFGRFSGYAEGGFPETGEIFVANEAGPELVGNIGHKTAVANQQQITDGIADATYNAMSRALQENNNSNGTMNPQFDVYIGNDKVYSGFGKFRSQESNKYGVTI